MKKRIKKAQKYLQWGKPNQAIAELRPLLKNKQEYSWIACHMMGIALSQKGQHESSAEYLNKAIASGSNEPETYHMLSVNHYNLGQFEKAEQYARKAIKLKDGFLKGWLNLGSVYQSQAKLDEALKCYQKANQLDPKNAGVAFRIGEIYRDQGDLDQALKLFDITLKIEVNHKKAILEKADVYKKQGNYEEALNCIEEAGERHGTQTPIQVSEAELYKSKGDYDKAIDVYEELLEKEPDNGILRVNYALCLQEVSRFDQSEKNYRRAIEDMSENLGAISNYLMGLHYNPRNSKEEIFKEHVRLGKEFGPAHTPPKVIPSNTARNKQLKIGFVSGGFRRHPVGWMIAGALEQLPEKQFEIYCYTTNNKYDFLTRRIHHNVDVWRSVVGYSTGVVDSLIRGDELDILVDLSGHAADNCLEVMARKPAPIIVKWVGGLFNTTGLEAFDYLITDWHESPEEEESYYTEKLVRLPDDYIVFTPPAYASDVKVLPAEKNNYITFGCFNNPTKVNEVVLKRWAEILCQVPQSRLYLKSKQYDTASFREQIIEVIEGHGIPGERIEFQGHSSHDDHLNAYNKVDVALDPWPYSGGLTTCEALYMGVPVVTLPGPTFAGRHSATHLINAGLGEFVADSWEEYTGKAVALAEARQRLKQLRDTLRDQLLDSPVCDGKRFGAHLSVAFRRMWEQWTEGYKNGVKEWQDHIAIESLSDKKINELTDGPEKTPLINIRANRKDGPAPEKEVNNNQCKEVHTTANIEEMDTTLQVQVNGRQTTPGANGQQEKVYHIETRDGITVCTPGDLDLLTPFVLLEQEQWFEPELDFIRQYLKSDMQIVDAGAGFGVYALPMAKQVGKKGKVFAFEPGMAARKHLEMSKMENGFEQLKVIGRGLDDRAGKAKLKNAETPEFNTIDKEGEEDINATTLDAWWNFVGQPTIDVMKVDVNGMEPKVLKGGRELLEQSSPVLLVSIGKGTNSLNKLQNQLGEMGYRLFEYIPGPGLLADHEPEAGIDSYLMNIIAIKNDQVTEFKESGWIFNEHIEFETPEPATWKQVLSNCPWTDTLIDKWEREIASGEHEEYRQALNLLCAAEQIDVRSSEDPVGRSRKGAMMLASAQWLIRLFNSGNAGIETAMTFARVMYQLGKRGQAVEMMKELMETVNSGGNTNVSLPFLPPLGEQDKTEVQTDFDKWLTVRIVEAWILMKDVSTYMSGKQEKKLLKALRRNPEAKKNIKKRISLIETDNGSNISTALNSWFWQEKEKNGTKYLSIDGQSKSIKNSGLGSLTHLYLIIPGEQGGAHGIHEIMAEKLAAEVKRQGVETSIISASNPYFIKKIANASGKQGHVFYAGVMGYDLSVHTDMNISGNIFDLFDVPVIGFLGDHPYTQFMWNRMERCARSMIFATPMASVKEEFKKIYGEENPLELIKYLPPPSQNTQWGHSEKPLKDRTIDVLIPWGLHKFFINQDSLEKQLEGLDPMAQKIGKRVYQKGMTEYEQSLFEIFLKVTRNKLGREYQFDIPKTKKDKQLMHVLSRVDWMIRKKRRLEILKTLTEVPDEFRIAITAHPEIATFLPSLKEKQNINWIGQVTAGKLDELYAKSKIVLNCNPTYPDTIHGRVRNGMANGCYVISDFNPVLKEMFGSKDAIGFINKQNDISSHLDKDWEQLQQNADKGRTIIHSKFTAENMAQRIIEIAVKSIKHKNVIRK